MKRKAVFIFLLCLPVLLFALPLAIPTAHSPPQPPLPTGFYPTNVANTVAFWNYRDIPVGVVNSWTDEVSGIVLTNPGGYGTPPYNTGTGICFSNNNGPNLLTNATFTTANNFSLWCVVAPIIENGTSKSQIYGNLANTSALVFDSSTYSPSNLLDGYWGSDNYWKPHWFGYLGGSVYGCPSITNSPLWADIVDAQGAIYLNGAATSGNIGKPSGTTTWQSLGGSLSGPTFGGQIKYILLCNNHAISAVEASNLYVWEHTNGVTNVSGNLVGWWKFADASNNPTIADSSGNGLTGTLEGSPKPVWTNGLNSIVQRGLAFDGVQDYVSIPFTLPSFTNTHQITISMWLLYTNVNNSGAFIESDGNSNSLGCAATALDDPVILRGGTGAQNGDIYTFSDGLVANDGSYHHFVWASDATNVYTWGDGIRLDTGNASDESGPNQTWYEGWASIQLSSPCYLGGGTFQQGSLTDIRIYNRILSDAEVDILYRSPTVDLIIGAYSY